MTARSRAEAQLDRRHPPTTASLPNERSLPLSSLATYQSPSPDEFLPLRSDYLTCRIDRHYLPARTPQSPIPAYHSAPGSPTFDHLCPRMPPRTLVIHAWRYQYLVHSTTPSGLPLRNRHSSPLRVVLLRLGPQRRLPNILCRHFTFAPAATCTLPLPPPPLRLVPLPFRMHRALRKRHLTGPEGYLATRTPPEPPIAGTPSSSHAPPHLVSTHPPLPPR